MKADFVEYLEEQDHEPDSQELSKNLKHKYECLQRDFQAILVKVKEIKTELAFAKNDDYEDEEKIKYLKFEVARL